MLQVRNSTPKIPTCSYTTEVGSPASEMGQTTAQLHDAVDSSLWRDAHPEQGHDVLSLAGSVSEHSSHLHPSTAHVPSICYVAYLHCDCSFAACLLAGPF